MSFLLQSPSQLGFSGSDWDKCRSDIPNRKWATRDPEGKVEVQKVEEGSLVFPGEESL